MQWIKDSKKICLVFHIDADGICSAYIIAKVIERIKGELPCLYALSSTYVNKNLRAKLKDYDLVIFTDLAVDSHPEAIREIAETSKVIIFDHHELTHNLNGPNVKHISTKMETKRYYPCSYQVYNYFNKEMDLSDMDWIAAVGLIGDTGAKLYKNFVESTLKKYGMKKCKDPNYFDTELGEMAIIIGAARVYNKTKGALKALKILLECESPKEFWEKTELLQKWRNKIQPYLDKNIKEFEKEAEKCKDVLIKRIKDPKYNIGSPLSSILSERYPNKTIILVVDKGNIAKVHARSKVRNLVELLSKATSGLKNVSCGGHKQAAGASIEPSDVTKFIRNLKKELGCK